ncbi:hemophore-related protein [Mycolicibacillus trivialis]
MILAAELRRVLAGAVVAAPLLLAVPVAHAAPADPCNPAVVRTVADGINGYLARHPDVNQSLIDINNEPPGQVSEGYHGYFDAHPDVAAELRALRTPLHDLQCVNTALPPQVVNALKAL